MTNKPGDLEKDREKISEGWAKFKDYPGHLGRKDRHGNNWGIGSGVSRPWPWKAVNSSSNKRRVKGSFPRKRPSRPPND